MPEVSVRLFSVLRDRVGASAIKLEFEPGMTVSRLIARAGTKHPELEPFRAVLRCAVNREYVDASRTIQPGDELAFITPVSGG